MIGVRRMRVYARYARHVVAAATLVAGAAALAQMGGGGGRGFGGRRQPQVDESDITNTPYDGRFTFARVRFANGGNDFWGGRDIKWAHDYPDAERNFMQILTELSMIRPFMEGGNVFALDDPELFKYPIAYLCEPGFWAPTDAEAAGLRAYLAKGGFIIFDDFYGGHWNNFEAAVRKVLPQSRLVRLEASHPIFDSFFRIDDLRDAGAMRRGAPEFWGIYEDNDPDKRLLAIANYNNDLGENWEYSHTGYFPVDVTNAAYKLGINYLVYAMTH